MANGTGAHYIDSQSSSDIENSQESPVSPCDQLNENEYRGLVGASRTSENFWITSQMLFTISLVKNSLNDSIGVCAYSAAPLGPSTFFKKSSESLGRRFPFSGFVFQFMAIVFLASM